jgi:hypothetical protein
MPLLMLHVVALVLDHESDTGYPEGTKFGMAESLATGAPATTDTAACAATVPP